MANLASNGDRNTNFFDGSCQHMNCEDSPHYWSVDLGKIITVNAVTITSPSIDMPVRISNFDVRVGFAEKYDDEDFENCVGHILGFGTNETRTIFCTNPIRGRYVAIRSFKTDCFHLCEVSVYGEELGEYLNCLGSIYSVVLATEEACSNLFMRIKNRAAERKTRGRAIYLPAHLF